WAGLRSAGQISRILYQLTADGFIAYDNAGTITLLHHPDHDDDRPPTQADQLLDRRPDQDADPDDQGSDRGDHAPDRQLDQGADPLARAMVLEIHEQQQTPAAAHETLPFMAPSDQAADRLHPAVQVLTELGAHETIIAEALRARPDLTPQQVEATWAW